MGVGRGEGLSSALCRELGANLGSSVPPTQLLSAPHISLTGPSQSQHRVESQGHHSMKFAERAENFFLISKQFLCQTHQVFSPRLNGEAGSSGQASTEHIVSFLLFCSPIAQFLILMISHSDAYLPSLASTLRSEQSAHDAAAPLFAKDHDDVRCNCLAEEGKSAFAWQFSHTPLG